MFTGLVECVGTVSAVSSEPGGIAVIEVKAPRIASKVAAGESVAVSGACLTVVMAEREVFKTHMMDETLRSTRLGSLKPGEPVNLERALSVGGRLDGHIVLGHVDEVGTVARIESSGSSKKIWFTASDKISWGIAAKGSVAIDGVSLTVVELAEGFFSVGLIPTTLGETTIGLLVSGDKVNIEIDVMARYAAQILRARKDNAAGSGVTWEKLREYGWS